MQAYNSIIGEYFCMGFIDFMLKGKSLLEYTNLFYLNDYEKDDKMILKYFQEVKRWKNYIALFTVSIENLKNLKYYTSIICSKCRNEDEELCKEEGSIEIFYWLV